MIYKSYKFRIYPTIDQQKFLNETLGACRKVYNLSLDEAIKEYENYKQDSTLSKPKLGGFDFIKRLPIIKNKEEYKWLYNYSSCSLQQKLLDLGKAFNNFFRDIKIKRKTGYPKFKSRFHNESFRLTPMYFKIVDNKLFIAKLSTEIKVKLYKQLPSEPSQVTITRTNSGKYYATFLCKTEPKVTNGSGIVGIDLGVKDFIVTSDNESITNPKYFNKYQNKLKLYQRRLSRKVKGSNNRNKARIKVAKIHETISNLRLDFIHKTTRSLVNRYKAICIEDLNVKGMSKNSHLSKHILDSGFGMFRRILSYKVIDSNWCNLIIANRWYPSTQICSNCGKKSEDKIKLSVRDWKCGYCDKEHNRDFNASKNLANIAKRPEIEDILIQKFGTIFITESFEI